MENFIKDRSNLLFIGCMFLGMAIGFKLNELGFGTMLGIGVGFILKYLAYNKDNKTGDN